MLSLVLLSLSPTPMLIIPSVPSSQSTPISRVFVFIFCFRAQNELTVSRHRRCTVLLCAVRLQSKRSANRSGSSTTSTSTTSGNHTPGHVSHQQPQQHQQQQQQPLLSGGGSASSVGQQQQQGVFIRGADRRVLQNLRVIQRTLVYAIGLTPTIAQASTLKQVLYDVVLGTEVYHARLLQCNDNRRL